MNDYKDPYVIDNTYHPGQWIYKDIDIDLDDSVWKEIEKISDGIWYRYLYNFRNEEDKMSLTKEYKRAKLNENEKLAQDYGALNEDGTLTDCGKDLLLNLLLEDKEIHDKFIKAIKDIEANE